MKAIAMLAVVAALSGCVSYKASRNVAIVGGAAIVAGIVAGVLDPDTGETDQHAINNKEAMAIVLVPVGIVLGLAGIVGMAAYGKPAATPRTPATTTSAR